MSLKRLISKGALAGVPGFAAGHLVDAFFKKQETGKDFTDCLKESVKETLTEDLPGTSHLYQSGRQEGKREGIVEQSKRDERKFAELHNRHEEDRRQWKKIDKKKDKLINDIINNKE